ncbi:Hypothetical protein Eab7_1396 [Exiguobacterium antarcticum B7]|nr:Hypothetical protein Eab7_1396 [Exiguobacterium antarcticum B7]
MPEADRKAICLLIPSVEHKKKHPDFADAFLQQMNFITGIHCSSAVPGRLV